MFTCVQNTYARVQTHNAHMHIHSCTCTSLHTDSAYAHVCVWPHLWLSGLWDVAWVSLLHLGACPSLQPATATATQTTATMTLRWTGTMPARTRTVSTKAGACASPARWVELQGDSDTCGWVGPRCCWLGYLGLNGPLPPSGPPPTPQHHTTGINCEYCLPGFYRDPDQPLDSPHTCRREWGVLGRVAGSRVCPELSGSQGPRSLPPRGPPTALGSRPQLFSHCPD